MEGGRGGDAAGRREMKHSRYKIVDTGTRYLVPIKISVKNKTVLIQRMALYPATATCIASAPLVPEPSSYSDPLG